MHQQEEERQPKFEHELSDYVEVTQQRRIGDKRNRFYESTQYRCIFVTDGAICGRVFNRKHACRKHMNSHNKIKHRQGRIWKDGRYSSRTCLKM